MSISRSTWLHLVAATALTAVPAVGVQAQTTPTAAEDVAALRAELDAMRARLGALEARLAAASAPAPVATAQSGTAAPAAAKAPANPKVDVAFKGGAPEITGEGGWSFKPRGRILIDAGTVSGPAGINDRSMGFASEMRRARLGVEGKIPGGFGYKAEFDFTEGKAEATDLFLQYHDKGWRVTVGQHNDFQSLEELTSSNDTSFMERAAFTDAFNFRRRVGVSGEKAAGPLLAQAGVFTDDVTALSNDENNSVGLAGRLVFAPKLGETQLHLGINGHWRDTGSLPESTRYRQRPLVHFNDMRFVATPTLAVERDQQLGLEGLVINGPFHVMAETKWLKARQPGALVDPTFFGAAIEAGYFFTGETRGYRDGMIKSTKVKKPLGAGGMGALSLNLRYDFLDLNDAGIVGGHQNAYMASLIWAPVDALRFMVNYARLQYDDAAIATATGDRDYGVDALGVRAQIVF